jgi:PAS domain S-box-containing protein
MLFSILGMNNPAGANAPDARRIRREIVVLFVVLSLLAVGMAVRATLTEHADRMGDAHARSLHLARGLEQHIGRLISGGSQYLIDMRNVIEEAGDLTQLPAGRLDRHLGGQLRERAIRPVLVIDKTGERWNVRRGEPVSVAHRDYFNYHLANRDRSVVVSKPVKSVVDGKWVIPISARVDLPDGSFGGVVLLGISADHLLEFYRSLGVDDDSSIALLGDDGTIFMRYPGFEHAVSTVVPPETMGRMRDREGTFEEISRLDDAIKICSYRRVAGHRLLAVVGLSRERVLAPWFLNSATRLAILLAALGALALFCKLLMRRVERETRVAASLQQFKAAVDQSADLVFWVGSDARLVYTNEAAARRMGYSREAITHVTVPQVAPEFPLERFHAFWEEVKSKGHVTLETLAVTRDGSAFPIEISASYLELQGDAYAFVIARDLTGEKQSAASILALNATLERRVRERTAELARANEDLESFGYSVSHDLRAPLRHASGYVQILQEDYGAQFPEGARELVQRIGERSRYMNELIDGLMMVTRVSREAVRPRRVDFSAAAAEIVGDLRRAEPARHVEVTIEPGMHAHGDLTLLRTLLQNLIGNAWKYTRKVGEARIWVTRDAQAPNGFCVSDNGVGFDPRYAQRLFTPFQRLHSASEYEGTGVGLATARRIVERHGGSIRAESLPDAGASFHFTLPGQA